MIVEGLVAIVALLVLWEVLKSRTIAIIGLLVAGFLLIALIGSSIKIVSGGETTGFPPGTLAGDSLICELLYAIAPESSIVHPGPGQRPASSKTWICRK